MLNGVAPAPVRNTEFTAALARTLGRLAVIPVPALALRISARRPVDSAPGQPAGRPCRRDPGWVPIRYPDDRRRAGRLLRRALHEDVWEQWLPAPPEAVFPFFSDPYNLEAITPDFLRFRVAPDLDVHGAGRHEDRLSAVTSRAPLALAERDRGLGATAALRRPTDAGTLHALASHPRVRAAGRRHADS